MSKTLLSASRGTGTAFPSAANAGDVFLRTDIGTNGTLFQYVGGSVGLAGWINESSVVCTSTTRPVLASSYAGMQIFETDTSRTYLWAPGLGTSGLWDQMAGPPEIYQMASYISASFQKVSSGAYGGLQIAKRGRDCWFEGEICAVGSYIPPANANTQFGSLPAAVMPITGQATPVSFYSGSGVQNYAATGLILNDGTCYFNPTGTAITGWNADLSGMRWRTNK